MTFEDGGVCTNASHIKVEGDTFNHDIHFIGSNFPLDGPVMQKRTIKWEPSTEIMFAPDGLLRGGIIMSLYLGKGGHYRCDFQTVFKPNKNVQMPGYHFVDHCIKLTSHRNIYNVVKLCEDAVAYYSPLEKPFQAKA